MEKIVAIYHGDCNDGTTAGAVVLKKFPNAQVFPLSYSSTKEDIDLILNTLDSETEIYTVDCGIGLQEILSKGYKVTTIDHHIGTKEEFENLAKTNPNFTFIFDNNKSGASLSWAYFFPDEPVPELIKYVEDIDLWKLKYGDDSKDINNYISIFRNDPVVVLGYLNGNLDEIKKFGNIISKYNNDEIKNLLELEPIKIKIGEYEVSAYNIENYRSEIGNILSKSLSKTAVMFTIDGDKVKFSFRSQEDNIPSALDLASKLGGGGHKKSAGGATSIKNFLEMIVRS